MSLQVWLPLNGNLDNYGLDGSKVPSLMGTEITYAAGKIGQAATFPNNCNSCIHFPGLRLQTGSWTAWLKVNGSGATTRQCPISEGRDSYTDGVEFYLNQAGTSLTFKAHGKTISTTIELNKWYHIAGIFGNGEVKFYLNGVLKGTQTYTDDMTYQYASDFTLGKMSYSYTNTSNYFPFNGALNDVRIYNHCLSSKEVEEISKGLILHYKLDQNINTLNNCYSYPTFNTSSSNGGWSHWGGTGHIGSYGQNTDTKYIFRKENTYSHWVANDDGATYNYLCYQSPAFEGGFRSLQAIIKEENSSPITETIAYPAWNARNGGVPNNLWTSVIHLGDGFYLCKCEGISQDGSNNLVGIYVRAGYKIYISEAYLENNRQICSDIFYQDSILTIYDSSGYNNNSISNGSITLESSINAPRYSYSTLFNSGARIATPVSASVFMPTDAITVNIWFKSSSAAARFISCTEGGGFNFESNSGNIRFVSYVAGQGYAYANSTTSWTSVSDNEWHMLTGINDKSTIKIYLDGQLIQETTSQYPNSALGYAGSTPFTLGAEAQTIASPIAGTYVGYLSDCRIYATALSANQIKELYDTSASIDSFGNIYSREVMEI